MLDIIIPSYNNLQGLYNTLWSIGILYDPTVVQITVIDDCSTTITKEDYQLIEQVFKHMPLQILYMEKNSGPGAVRNYGVSQTNKPFILFVDCGDLINGPMAVQTYLGYITAHSDAQMIETTVMQPVEVFDDDHNLVDCKYMPMSHHNCFYGTLFSRSLFNNFKIPTTYSYNHEDIPFVISCRCYCIEHGTAIQIDDGQVVIVRTTDDTSMTHDKIDFSNKLLVSMLENTSEILETAELSQTTRACIIYNIMCCIYFNLIGTKDKAEYESLVTIQKDSIYNFYFQYYKPIKDKYPQYFALIYKGYVLNHVQSLWDEKFWMPIDINQLDELIETDTLETLRQF